MLRGLGLRSTGNGKPLVLLEQVSLDNYLLRDHHFRVWVSKTGVLGSKEVPLDELPYSSPEVAEPDLDNATRALCSAEEDSRALRESMHLRPTASSETRPSRSCRNALSHAFPPPQPRMSCSGSPTTWQISIFP